MAWLLNVQVSDELARNYYAETDINRRISILTFLGMTAWIPAAIKEYAREKYGFMAPFLDHPEIGPILEQAAAAGWSQEKLDAAIRATNWWTTKSDTEREWLITKTSDPAAAAQRLDQMVFELRSFVDASGVGGQFSDATLRSLGETFLSSGFQGEQLQAAILAHAHFTGETPIGAIGASMDQIQARALQYGFNMGDETAWEYSKAIASGRQTLDGVEVYLRNQAKSMFPQLSADLDSGFTTRQIVDPYIEQTARLLEGSASDFQLTDDVIANQINFVDSEGQRRIMSLSEAGRYVRNTPEWEETDNAKQGGAGVVEQILSTFGEVART